MNTNDNRGWIVRSGDSYLCPKDGDVGYTTDLAEAGTFGSVEEAMDAGRDHCDPGFVVMPVPGVDERLKETMKAVLEYAPDEHGACGDVDARGPQYGVSQAVSPSNEPTGLSPYLALSKARRHLSRGTK